MNDRWPIKKLKNKCLHELIQNPMAIGIFERANCHRDIYAIMLDNKIATEWFWADFICNSNTVIWYVSWNWLNIYDQLHL